MGFRLGKILLILVFASGGDGAWGAAAKATPKKPAATTGNPPKGTVGIFCNQVTPCWEKCVAVRADKETVESVIEIANIGDKKDKQVCLPYGGDRIQIPTNSTESRYKGKCYPGYPNGTTVTIRGNRNFKVNDHASFAAGSDISTFKIWKNLNSVSDLESELGKVRDASCCDIRGAPGYSARWDSLMAKCLVTKPNEKPACKKPGETPDAEGKNCVCKTGFERDEAFQDCVPTCSATQHREVATGNCVDNPADQPKPEQAAAELKKSGGICGAGQVAVFLHEGGHRCLTPPTYQVNKSGMTFNSTELSERGLTEKQIKDLENCGASGALDTVRNVTSVDIDEESSGTVYVQSNSTDEDIRAANYKRSRDLKGKISGNSKTTRETEELLKSGKLINAKFTNKNHGPPDSGTNFKSFCEYLYKRMIIIAAVNEQNKGEAIFAVDEKGKQTKAAITKSGQDFSQVRNIYDKTKDLAAVAKQEADSLIGKQEAQIKELEEARAAKAKATDLVKSFTIEGEKACQGAPNKFASLQSAFAKQRVSQSRIFPVCGYFSSLEKDGVFPKAEVVFKELADLGLRTEQVVFSISEQEKKLLIRRDQQLGRKRDLEKYFSDYCDPIKITNPSQPQILKCREINADLVKIVQETIPTLNKDLALLSADREKIKGVSIDYKAEIKRASLLWGKNADGLAILKTYEEEDKKQQAMLKSLQDTISKEKAENEQTSFNTMDAISKLKKMADDLFGGKPGEGMNFDPGQFDPGGPPPAPGPTVDDIMGNAVIGNDSPVAFSPPVNNGPPAGSISDGRGVVGRVGGGSGGGNPSLEDLYHSLATNNPADPDASLGSTEQNLLKPFTPEAAGVIGDARAPKGNTAREKVPLSNRKPGNAPAGQGGSGGGLAGGSGGGGPNKKMNAGEEAGPQFVGNLPNMNYNGTSGGVAPLSFGGGGEGGGSGTDFAAVMPTEADFSKKDAAGLEALDSSKVGAGRVAAATDGLAGIGESIFKIVSDGYLRKQINWKGK